MDKKDLKMILDGFSSKNTATLKIQTTLDKEEWIDIIRNKSGRKQIVQWFEETLDHVLSEENLKHTI